MKAAAILLLVAVSFAMRADEVVARQGGAKDNIERFDSPMILELTFPVAGSIAADGKPTSLGENLSKYVCANVAIENLIVRAAPFKNGSTQLTYLATVHNRPGIDKRVDITYQLFDGETTISYPALVKNMSIEEGSRAQAKASAYIESDALRAHPEARLRLTLTVRDDG